MGLREDAEREAVRTMDGLNAFADKAEAEGKPVTYAVDTEPHRMLNEPDVDESPNSAAGDVPVHEAWRRMMRDVQWLGKGRQSRDYMYRGIDDVMNLVGPAERKHGVFVMPTGVEPTFEVINTKSGSPMNYARIICHFTIYGPRGDTMLASCIGEGFDTGDKSGTKAQSVALRTLYLNALAIQTNEPARDTEYGTQHEIAGPPRPTADQYQVEILNKKTTIDRLRQIRAELNADPVMGATEVDEGFGGDPVKLIDLVIRVGRSRSPKRPADAEEGN